MQFENIDFSEICIENMSSRNAEKRPEMKWVVMDIMDLKYEDASMDIVLDKGTMDAIMCEKGDVWNISDELAVKLDKMLSEVSRVLKPGGKYIYITFGQPHFRKPHMLKDKYNWTFQQETIGTKRNFRLQSPSYDFFCSKTDAFALLLGETFHYFVYILTKKSE